MDKVAFLKNIKNSMISDYEPLSKITDERLEALHCGAEASTEEEQLLCASLATQDRSELIRQMLNAQTLRYWEEKEILPEPTILMAAATKPTILHEKRAGYTFLLAPVDPGKTQWGLTITLDKALMADVKTSIIVKDNSPTPEVLMSWLPGDDVEQSIFFSRNSDTYQHIFEHGIREPIPN